MSATPATNAALESQRRLLLATTAIAVVSDAVLIPFYPQLFSAAFGVTDPQHVGTYLAATCLTVIVTFPVWARIEKRSSTLGLLPTTQLCAGLLSVACYFAQDLRLFWLLSLLMIVFKGSYLLIYPYLMRIEEKASHAQAIGLLTVIVHLGGITGATSGGLLLQTFAPQHAFLVMAAGDFIQMGVCLFLRLFRPVQLDAPSAVQPGQSPPTARQPAKRRPALVKLGAVMLLFYFSAFIVRPFFVPYWATRSAHAGELVSGLVFAIPGWTSLVCLWLQRRGHDRSPWVPHTLLIGIAGLLLQATPYEIAILLGRCAYGWAVFHAMVRLDLQLFQVSAPEDYATDFSRMNFCQQLGVLVAFYAAGSAVAIGGLRVPFFLAAIGFAATAVAYAKLFSVQPAKEGVAAP